MLVLTPEQRESIRRKIFEANFFIRKNLTILFRSHLSHGLAVFLAVTAGAREIMEYYHLKDNIKPQVWFWSIVLLSVLTFFAALWELFGNKLATSKQEVRFILGINALLEEFNSYERKLQEVKTTDESETLLQNFIQELLKASSGIICGKHNVDVALMLENPVTKELILEKDKFYQSDEVKEIHKYPEQLVIPLEDDKDEEMIGPAEKAFKEKIYIVHMPNKKKRMGVLIKQSIGEDYSPKGVFKGWYPSGNESNENFCSVVSVPVVSYKNENESDIFGVLNFTTRINDLWINRDLFVDRDYIMASCFAVLLAQAIVANKKRIEEVKQ